VGEAAGESGRMADEVLQASERVAGATDRLKGEVNDFINKVQAA
jgi:hypothetical protein